MKRSFILTSVKSVSSKSLLNSLDSRHYDVFYFAVL